MSDTTTNGIRIFVTSRFLNEHSNVDEGVWVFSYTVDISNIGTQPFQLISRHWIITNGWNHVEEVKGPGVVGEQPRLEPGEGFRYTSFCPLTTPTGNMRGSYRMLGDDGEEFDAQIMPFTLSDPTQLN